MSDTLTDAVLCAVDAVKAALPSQAPAFAVSGVRETSRGSRKVRLEVSAVVLSDADGDPILAESSGSSARTMTLLVRAGSGDGAWSDPTEPRVGDVYTDSETGERYRAEAVTSVRRAYHKVTIRKC